MYYDHDDVDDVMMMWQRRRQQAAAVAVTVAGFCAEGISGVGGRGVGVDGCVRVLKESGQKNSRQHQISSI